MFEPWKEDGIALFKILACPFFRVTEDRHEKLGIVGLWAEI
jgi:hypothetical protein